MIASHKLFDMIYDLPVEWKDVVWMNNSDLPNEENPKSSRCSINGSIRCCHNYLYKDDGIWIPTTTAMKSIPLVCQEYRIFYNENFRLVWIGQCPVCQRVHYNVERMDDEWFDLDGEKI